MKKFRYFEYLGLVLGTLTAQDADVQVNPIYTWLGDIINKIAQHYKNYPKGKK